MFLLKFHRIVWTVFGMISLQGCNKEEESLPLNHEIQVQEFSIKTPEGWYLVEEQGYDSYVGRITDGKRTIYYDYGGPMTDVNSISENEHTIYLERLSINGDSAVIHKKEEVDGIYLTAYIQGESNTTKLYVKDPHNDQFYINIFKTHLFE